ncbi:MAG TPA: 5-formyltetrahydrofolate cyclo-ligase [Firmicutes bacterium]|nr:5-formyltetrahydrofolate cyclo-ligase [Bacillota bacterium]
MAKLKLRRRLQQERAAVPEERRRQWDNLISEYLKGWDRYRRAEKVMVYLAFGWEISTENIVADLWQRGSQVFVPVVDKRTGALLTTVYTKETVLAPAAFGILEPVGSKTIDPAALDLVLVPGLAFTEEGYRIGYGGGYYDRFLQTTEACRVGLCYSQFLLPKLPLDPWDQAVHFIATEEGILSRK